MGGPPRATGAFSAARPRSARDGGRPRRRVYATYFTDIPPGRHYVTVGKVSDEVELRAGGVTHLDVYYATPPSNADAPTATAGKYVDNRDNYFELHIGND